VSRARTTRAPRRRKAADTAGAPTSFAQRAGASTRQLLMFELVRARATVLAATQGLTAASADRPLGAGRWSTRETVLHLIARDEARLRELESALAGVPVSWTGWTPVDWARDNLTTMAPLAHLGWEEAMRRLHATRDELMRRLLEIPEEPATRWTPAHALGAMLEPLPEHDRHHAGAIKRWRSGAAS
jgi:hypothetical protein